MPATIKDIAARAGVSISTVHYALRRTRPISDATRNRVLRAVEELDYQPNAGASALPSGRTSRIAVVVAGIEPAFANTYFSDFIRGLAAAAEAEEHTIVLVTAYGRRAAEGWRPLHLLRRREADAVVLAGTQFARAHLDELAEAGAPCVLLNHFHPGLSTVTADRGQGTEVATRHLLDSGCWPVGLIAADFPGSAPAQRRPELAGYRRAMASAARRPCASEANLVRFLPVQDAASTPAADLVRGVVESESGGRPGIVVFSYTLGPLAAAGIASTGLDVPRRLGVVFGDEDSVYQESLGLAPTVVRAPKFDMAQEAIDLALAQLRGEHPVTPVHRQLPMELVVRQSCGALALGGRPMAAVGPGQSQQHQGDTRAAGRDVSAAGGR